MEPLKLIFDIGKTNKKFFLFDKDYRIVFADSIQFDEIKDEDGDKCDDLPKIKEWILEKWETVSKDPAITLEAVNFTAYGASMVHLDEHGEPLTPMYNYLKEYPERLREQFRNIHGDISIETASPSLGMLNSGMQLYWLKFNKPELFRRIKYSLHLPNFLSYLLTKNAVTEYTSIGCHTSLWNFKKNKYHEWIEEENLQNIFPDVNKSAINNKIQAGDSEVFVGNGVHDSSAALIPYLITNKEPFLLCSTGTWCITFNPFSNREITEDDLRRDCLYYMTTDGNPVKASRIFLGKEHEYQSSRIAKHFDLQPDFYKNFHFDKNLIEKLLVSGNQLNPAHLANSGPVRLGSIEEWDLTAFDDHLSAYHQLILDLACLQKISIDLSKEEMSAGDLFIEGAFSKNNIFLELLAAFYADLNLKVSALKNTAALGALLVLDSNHSGNIENINSDFTTIPHQPIEGLNKYWHNYWESKL
ncbi:MAG: carbohydrate kinase [Bacteroidetes bacterium]|nr:carbohydrate kinase [Bacteroidota bacterium]